MNHHLYCIKQQDVIIYIGVTKNDIDIRFKEHRRSKKLGQILSECESWIEILAIGERDYIYDLEIRAITAFNTRYPQGFNLDAGGYKGRERILPSTRAKISAAVTRRVRSATTRAKISAANIGNKRAVGHIYSAETRTKISVAQIGHIISAATRAKLSAAKMGNKHGTGHIHSAATRAKMSAAAKKRWAKA